MNIYDVPRTHGTQILHHRGLRIINISFANHSDCPLTFRQSRLRSSSLTVFAANSRPSAVSRSGKWTSLIIVADDDSRFAPGGDDAYYRNDPVKYDLNQSVRVCRYLCYRRGGRYMPLVRLAYKVLTHYNPFKSTRGHPIRIPVYVSLSSKRRSSINGSLKHGQI